MKAVFHIGTTKTGTTSIQKFLNANRDRLRAQGVLYTRYMKAGRFGPEQPEYMRYVFSKLRRLFQSPVMAYRQGFRTLEELDRMVEGFDGWLAGQAATEGCHTFVASSELIWADIQTVPGMRALHDLLSAHFDEVRYVLYIRRQDKWLLSAYSQAMRNNGTRSLGEFLKVRGVPDYFDYVRKLADVAGEDSIELRLFEREELRDGDVISDFCAVTGIDTGGLEWPERVNESLSRRAIGFLRRCNRMLEHLSNPGSRRHARLSRAARDFAQRVLNGGPQLAMARADRDRILAECADSNERLRRWFFPQRETLFDMRDVAKKSGGNSTGRATMHNLHDLNAPGLPGAEPKSN